MSKSKIQVSSRTVAVALLLLSVGAPVYQLTHAEAAIRRALVARTLLIRPISWVPALLVLVWLAAFTRPRDAWETSTWSSSSTRDPSSLCTSAST